jgi:hypothetical protein
VWSELHVTFLYGRTLHGYVCGFEPSHGYVDLWATCDTSAPRQAIPLSLVRKLVFVRGIGADGVGRPIAPAPERCLQPVEVTFRNNELVAGSALGYSEANGGLWIFPPRMPAIFAVASAVREIRFF